MRAKAPHGSSNQKPAVPIVGRSPEHALGGRPPYSSRQRQRSSCLRSFLYGGTSVHRRGPVPSLVLRVGAA
eukprot:scaffold324_cov394-Prasinococcus_capsulatus_cf.AAC.18